MSIHLRDVAATAGAAASTFYQANRAVCNIGIAIVCALILGYFAGRP